MIKKYLDDALLFEAKGYDLYIKLAAESKNDLSRKLFESLAEQEKYHIAYIKSYAAKTEMKKVKFDQLEASIKRIYQDLNKNMIGKDLSQIDGITQALQMEKSGYALYAKAHKEAATNVDKDFFSYLMEMENEHYEALANLMYYYTSNDQWLSQEESKVWNWMNF